MLTARHRDQELRFTVHDSPDYYKLKCSVFNDDKKTDLIGEAWLSLAELIKPGGGSNDLWHQLNYKGKYAGDIRVELTYYDLRPREERASERKKQRERTSTPNSDIAAQASAVRQLGPREVRRRPLPASPASTTPITPSPVQTPPAVTPQRDAPARPPKIPLAQYESPYTQPVSHMHEEEQPFPSLNDQALVVQQSNQHYRQPFCEDQMSTADQQDEFSWNNEYNEPLSYSQRSPSSSMMPSPSSLPPSSWPGDDNQWDYSDRHDSQRFEDQSAIDLAMTRALPSPPTHSSESQRNYPRPSTSPAKATLYRDSPLRQAMNHEELDLNMVMEPESYDAPPPPPPMHRDTPPRRVPQEYPPSSFPYDEQSVVPFAPQARRPTSRRVSFDEKSPLQQIESQYARAHSQAAPYDQLDRHHSYGSYTEDESQQYSGPDDNNYRTPERRDSYDAYQGQEASTPNCYHRDQYSSPYPSQEPSYQKAVYPERSSSHDSRRLSGNPDMMVDHNPVRAHSHSQPDLSRTDYSKPEVVRPKPISVNSGQRPQRKAVSPGPYPPQDGRRLSAVPFGPDAYDVLNPASSPVTNHGTVFQTAQQAKESARIMEVQKLRGQGPIIGNDGRVIDPSDHLPSDTWAPEPEKKERRPEHVIHYRTKNDTRLRNQTSPTQTSMPHSRQSNGVHSTPSPTSGPSSGTRNRLQKPSPTRPLPTQPFSPARPDSYHETSPTSNMPPHQAGKRNSYHEPSQAIHRPSLSEYQVPANNSYVPRGTSFTNDYHPTPSRSQMQTGRDYNPRNSSFHNDPLAVEMSMIDIGPGRAGQMVLSGRRGY